MEKDLGKISKNADTDIIIRIDDFGGKVGLTIREFVKGERYTGFTKAGTRIPVEKIKEFKAMINSISESELANLSVAASKETGEIVDNKSAKSENSGSSSKQKIKEFEEKEF